MALPRIHASTPSLPAHFLLALIFVPPGQPEEDYHKEVWKDGTSPSWYSACMEEEAWKQDACQDEDAPALSEYLQKYFRTADTGKVFKDENGPPPTLL